MDWENFWIGFAIVFLIISFTGICFYGTYKLREIRYENFQTTIQDLTDEQKCIHICGFTYPETSYLENYKFCMEKCDRISERQQKVCTT